MRVKSRYPETIEYQADSVWDGKTGCKTTTSEGRSVVFDTPTAYGGAGDGFCPDEIFVSAVLACLNNTFLDFQRKFEMELMSLKLTGKASVNFDNEGYRIMGIAVSGEVIVGEDELETGERCVELMKKFCHLTRSFSDSIPVTLDVNVREA